MENSSFSSPIRSSLEIIYSVGQQNPRCVLAPEIVEQIVLRKGISSLGDRCIENRPLPHVWRRRVTAPHLRRTERRISVGEDWVAGAGRIRTAGVARSHA